MLGTAKADTFSAQLSGFLRISRSICVGSYFQSSIFVSPCHDTTKLTSDGSIHRRDNTVIDLTSRAVNGQWITLMELFACQSELLVGLIHSNLGTAGYTTGTHTTGNHSSVTGHTTANRQDALSRLHTFNILRRGLQANQHYLFASSCPCFSIFGREYDLAAGSAR